MSACALHEWRRELLTQRIRDLNSVSFIIKGNSYRKYGAPKAMVGDMIREAIHHLEAGELDLCEHACVLAERAQIDGIRERCHG
jgi:hypothetical protein